MVIFSHIPVLATGICAIWRYRHFSRPLRVFSWFIFLSVTIQFASLALWWARKNNMPLLHIYVAIELPCLIWFYKSVLGNYVQQGIMWGIALSFLLFTVINSIWIQHIFRFNSNALFVESILIIILALFTFIFLLNNNVKEAGRASVRSITWINSGLFIYYLSCLLIFYFGDIIIFHFSRDLSRLTWIFHSFFSIIMYCCFLTGLWKYPANHYS